MRFSQFIFLLILSTYLTTPAHAAWPPEFKARYQLHKYGMNAAEVNISLNVQNDNSLLYQSNTKTKGLVSMFRDDSITENTILEKTASGFRPINYHYVRKSSKKNRNRSINFDYINNKAQYMTRGKVSEVDLKPGMHDAFSLQLKMMNDMHAGNRELDYTVIYKGKLKRYQFKNMGTENIETTAGTYSAIKLKRVRENGKRTTYMWVASQLHFLPVKITHIEKNGEEFSLELDNISGAITNKPANN